jgi:hypothetical protein
MINESINQSGYHFSPFPKIILKNLLVNPELFYSDFEIVNSVGGCGR